MVTHYLKPLAINPKRYQRSSPDPLFEQVYSPKEVATISTSMPFPDLARTVARLVSSSSHFDIYIRLGSSDYNQVIWCKSSQGRPP
jgi:hypothetical protein